MKIIAEALQAVESGQAALLLYGPMGIMLAWFMLRAEKVFSKLGDLAHRIDGLTKALLIDMIERESSGARTKKFANDAIAKIDARAANDEKKNSGRER